MPEGRARRRNRWRAPVGRTVGLLWWILSGWLLLVWATAGAVGVDASNQALPMVTVAAVIGLAIVLFGARRESTYVSIGFAVGFAAWASIHLRSTDPSFAGSFAVALLLACLIVAISGMTAVWDIRQRG